MKMVHAIVLIFASVAAALALSGSAAIADPIVSPGALLHNVFRRRRCGLQLYQLCAVPGDCFRS
jgi:hypothetical protein